ncbi:MAG: hypothetical protein ABFD90_09025 [Phycisphaerales bacterium]
MPGRREATDSKTLTGRMTRLADAVLGRKYDILESIAREFDRGDSCPEIVYFGDSTILRISDEDRDRRSTADMLAADLSGKARVLELSHGAYHMGIYYHMVNTFRITRTRPRLLVIPINMRSFSPQWYLRPSWEFKAEIGLLRRYYSRKGLRTRYRKADVATGYEETRVECPLTNLRTIGEFETLRLSSPPASPQREQRRKELFAYFFLCPISDGHPLLVKLREMVKLARMLRIVVLFYMTPINVEAASDSVGPEFDHYFSRNLQVVRAALAEEGCVFVKDGCSEGNDRGDRSVACMDFSRALASDCFFHPGSIDEHLNEKGRKFISKEIGAVVPMLLGETDAAAQQD